MSFVSKVAINVVPAINVVLPINVVIIFETLLLVRFYLPHMEYEGSIGLVTGKMKKKITDFHV
jgi:hypothetical protein